MKFGVRIRGPAPTAGVDGSAEPIYERIMSRTIHFEIQADDPPRAIRFYEAVLGWKFAKWGPVDYWLITTGEKSAPGIDGGLMPRKGPRPADDAPLNAYACTMDVADLDATLANATAAGGSIVVAKNAVPTIGWLAYCKDTEGNIFGVMQSDPSAK